MMARTEREEKALLGAVRVNLHHSVAILPFPSNASVSGWGECKGRRRSLWRSTVASSMRLTGAPESISARTSSKWGEDAMCVDQTRWESMGGTYSEDQVSSSSVPKAPTIVEAKIAATGPVTGV